MVASSVSSDVGARLRELAWWGARNGPAWWLRYSPTPIGVAAFCMAGRQRAALRRRLGWVLGAQPNSFAMLKTFVNFAHCLAETMGGESHAVQFEADGLGVLNQCASGAIVLTAHTGAWELAAGELATSVKRPVLIVMRAESNVAARRVHEALRRRAGVRELYIGDPLVGLQLLEALQQQSIVAFQIDRLSESGRSVRAQLFGREFPIPEGPLRLASRCQVPLVPVFCARSGFLRHSLRAFPPIRVSRSATPEQLQAAAQSVASSFEAFVATQPYQWFDFAPVQDGSLERIGDRS